MIIAVSGNVGSGKTTLAQYLAEEYNFIYVPQKRLEFNFIDDFFDDIEGRFFPAQVSFLLSKAIELQEIDISKNNVVIDRSLVEDIEVFAKLWIENKNIDPKIVQLYRSTAEFIRTSVPSPDLYIVCKCPSEVSVCRIAKRKKRRFEEKYPVNHVKMLAQYYTQLNFESDIPVVTIDTLYYDFTKKHDLKTVCDAVFERIKAFQNPVQLSFFNQNDTTPNPLKGMEFHNFSYSNPLYNLIKNESDYIYLAAPFTQVAEESIIDTDTEELTLFSDILEKDSYGILPESYKKNLTKIKKALEERYKKHVFIPHKEINNWGKTKHPSEYLALKIMESVKNASAVVAVPGNSLGVHLELGIAIAYKIPTVIFDVGEYECGYLLRGFAESNIVKYIQLPSIRNIANEIRKNDILKC